MTRPLLTTLAALAFVGCDAGAPTALDPAIDLGGLDAGPADAAHADRDPPDAAPVDAAPVDAASDGAPAPDATPNRPPVLDGPSEWTIAEAAESSLRLAATDPDGDPVRLFLLDRPPGSRWIPAEGRLVFTPDFTQGGRQWRATVVADDGSHRVEAPLLIDVEDTIQPPPPQIVSDQPGDGFRRLTVRQTTDAWLDSPGFAGRTFDAVLTVPEVADEPGQRLPVRVVLHGFGGAPWGEGWRGELRIAPHDPFQTYWWGYAQAQPGGPAGEPVPDYTQRRVAHLLAWALDRWPGADRDNVYVEGESMGGAGAATFGLRYARHVSLVQATIGQSIPRNHRPSRLAQLAGHYGPAAPGGVWDEMDLTRVLADDPTARDQYIFLKHGRDDPLIHFGAVVQPSPLTGQTIYQALQAHRVGHLAVWDEGGHGPPDPVLGAGWWSEGWNPAFDDTASLRRRAVFPAFSGSSADGDPGDGGGNGRRPFDPESGFAGVLDTPGDTGWAGDLAGALNRGLRWDATHAVDTLDALEIPLRALDANRPAPRPGYPPVGDGPGAPLPVTVDVTLRRVQRFQCLPGERVAYRFGGIEGEVIADADGVLTVPGVALTARWQTLRLARIPVTRD